MVRKSQNCNKIGGSTNSTFLALIPKEKGANSFERFRPISLCNIGYKLITKVIANRIKEVLPSIIPENQGGFIQGRQIVDNIILVQEVIHSSINHWEKGMVIKLDLANSYDRVNYEFLFQVMLRFGFDPGLVRWIQACIKALWIAPLVNGRATNFSKFLVVFARDAPCLQCSMSSKLLFSASSLISANKIMSFSGFVYPAGLRM